MVSGGVVMEIFYRVRRLGGCNIGREIFRHLKANCADVLMFNTEINIEFNVMY